MRISDWSSDVCSSDLLFRYYFSDAHSAVTAGHDIRTSLLAFGCDATHGYERTHIDSLAALSRLLGAYILSPPVFASDAHPAQGSQIGRASCRERVCQYLQISGVAVSFKKKYYK